MTAGVWVGVAVPFLLAVWAAARSTRVNLLLDFWYVLSKVTDDGGGLLVGPLFSYYLEQPFAVPSLLFYSDAAVFGGDNRVLTVLAVVLLGVVVAALVSMLAPRGAVRAAVAVVFSSLVFTPHLSELWVQASNGVSWAPALALAVCALAAAHRGRHVPALVAAVGATLSFGSGLAVWFPLAVVAWVRRDKRWALAHLGAGVVVVGAWLLTRPPGPQAGAIPGFAPVEQAKVVLATLGAVWSAESPRTAVVAGGLVALVLLVLVIFTLGERDPLDAGWIGLAGYAGALAVLIGVGRASDAVPGSNTGMLSRYAVVGVLALCAVIAMVVRRVPARRSTAVAGVAVAVLVVGATYAAGLPKEAAVRASYAPLGVVPVALRMESVPALDQLDIEPTVLPAAKALGMYPFDGGFTLGCHGVELGDTVDLGRVEDLPPSAGTVDSRTLVQDTVVAGWAAIPADCVLAVSAEGEVVGGGVTRLQRPDVPHADGLAGFRVVLGPGTRDVLVHDGQVLRRVTGRADPEA
ncbi:DUF2079 domain-containing protein [Actinokineospora pegani]|uniref:DUF2079 domain-containing protein n=1 Tax=Actinokineospora pegani TaxID=2654637 RepID=UPI0018D335E7|nr:DUF2079 domain-containing protein [Actinokineospora pegani]